MAGNRLVSRRKALAMVSAWVWRKLSEQFRSIIFIVAYLMAVQLFVLRVPLQNAISITLGLAATVLGLALFLEGLFLGIMPLGEHCGLTLPGKAKLFTVIIFSLVLGVTATLAEPAIGFLQLQGRAVQPWDKPLLYYLLNTGSLGLVLAIAGGVGLAVMLGVLRFLYSWSFKPFIFIFFPILLVLSFFFSMNDQLRSILGLAWDTGGVTTGPVTVPLVIALGVGISRIVGQGKDSSSSLGVVSLASALPVLAVALLALVLLPKVPAASNAQDFFSVSNRPTAEFVLGGGAALQAVALQAVSDNQLSEEAFMAAFPGMDGSIANIRSVLEDDDTLLTKLLSSLAAALRVILPLTFVLLFTLMIVLRQRVQSPDTVALGLVFALAGMFFFGIGMEQGLSELGSQVGRNIPRAYSSTEQPTERLLLPLDPAALVTVNTPQGSRPHFWISEHSNDTPRLVPYKDAAYNPQSGMYEYIPVRQAVFNRFGPWAGYAVALLFVFILGIGATLAEPSLRALGVKLEEMTTGTYKSANLVRTVAIGVGLGMTVGFGRILVDVPLFWVLAVPYLLALVLTAFSSEEFSAIAWDSGGVTTGPVTVPLLIATGLGLGANAGAGDAFGVVACASVFPIISVLLSGLVRDLANRRSLAAGLPQVRQSEKPV